MKHKGIIGLASSLFLLGVLASPVLAAGPTVTDVSPASGGTGAIPVTITGTRFDGPAVVSVSGAGVVVGSVVVTSNTTITATFIVAVDAAPTTRDVSVTVGAETGSAIGAFTVIGSITVEAPTGGSLSYMTAGATRLATLTPGTVTTNYGTWQVSAVDSKVTKKGYMTTGPDGSGNSLAAPFQISKTAGGYADASTALVYDQTTDSGKILPLSVSQDVAADAAAGSYQITITFTASGS
jgi:hypothetical protein